MERRRFARKPGHVPCEIVRDGRRELAILTDVSPGGGSLQTEADVALGEELEIWFADDQFAPQVGRARVVRRRVVPSLLTPLLKPGVGVEWSEPPAFALLETREVSDLVEVEVELAGDETPALRAPGPVPPPAEEPAPPAPVAAATNLLSASPSGPPPDDGDTLDLSGTRVSAEVVVIDEGELDDVTRLLRELGSKPHRMRWGAQAEPSAWEELPRLVVATARVALAVPITQAAKNLGVRGIAVCDSSAHTLRLQLRRQGYDLIIQRGVHAETLRLLFGALLHRRRERRRERRRAFGAPVRVRRGWRRFDATFLELTSTSGRLLASRAIPLGTRLAVRIPAEFAGGRAITLRAVVERVAKQGGGVTLGVSFERPAEREQKRLAALLERLDAGPVTDPRAPRADVAPARPERRSGERRQLQSHVLAFDALGRRVRDVLFGTDLSVGGMRVEWHPGLVRGERVRIALQVPLDVPPIVLRAEVARDDGPRGLVLRFIDVSEGTQLAIRRVLETAVEVESLRRGRESAGDRLVLGELVREAAAEVQ